MVNSHFFYWRLLGYGVYLVILGRGYVKGGKFCIDVLPDTAFVCAVTNIFRPPNPNWDKFDLQGPNKA